MAKLNIQVMENDYERLEQIAKQMGKTVQDLIHEWVKNLPEQDVKKVVDVTRDSVYQMEGYESSAPKDLSKNIDKYLYGEE
ncbi:MAG: hypothetical protein AB1498_04000 [bacterium]